MSTLSLTIRNAPATGTASSSRIVLVNQSVTGPAGADGAGVSVATKESGTTKVTVTTALDFDGTNFDVTGSSGTASIVIAAGQFATAAQGATADAAVPKALYDANTILAATSDDTPAALTVAASTFVGRKASGNIAAMTADEALAVLAPTGTPSATTYLRGDKSWATPAGGGSSGPFLQRYKSGRYYPRPELGYSNRTLGADYVYFCPFMVPFDCTLDRLGVSIVGAASAGKSVRLGIYATDGSTSLPTTVLASGTVAADSTGAKSVTISQAVTAGTFYMLAAQAEGSITVNGWQYYEVFGNTTLSPQNGAGADMYVAAAYASGLPTSPTITNDVATSSVPVLQARAA